MYDVYNATWTSSKVKDTEKRNKSKQGLNSY